jgi:hypothetical protein
LIALVTEYADEDKNEDHLLITLPAPPFEEVRELRKRPNQNA